MVVFSRAERICHPRSASGVHQSLLSSARRAHRPARRLRVRPTHCDASSPLPRGPASWSPGWSASRPGDTMTALAHAPVLGARMLRTAARGAVLVGAAVVLGIILLQVVHDSGTPSAGGGTKVSSSTTTTTGTTGTTGATRTASVTVLNGSGVTGAATTRANPLRGLGYAIKATTNAAATQTGTTAVCTSGDLTVADDIAKSIGPTVTATVSPTLP